MYKNIGVIFPSSFVSKEKICNTFSIFKNKGYNIITARDEIININGFAGTEEEKIAEIHSIYSNKNVDIVIAFNGGIGLSRIVDRIDYSIIKKSNKKLMGYSDLTLLHNAIINNTNLPTFYSPMLDWASRENDIDKASQEYFFNFLNGIDNRILSKQLFQLSTILKNTKEKIIGKCVGGNLEGLIFSSHTKNDFDTDNKIFLIENVGNEISQVHEMLIYLKRIGKFNNIKALLAGGMNYIKYDGQGFKSSDELILDLFKDCNFPIMTNCPFGHDFRKMIIPLNQDVVVDFNNKEFYVK